MRAGLVAVALAIALGLPNPAVAHQTGVRKQQNERTPLRIEREAKRERAEARRLALLRASQDSSEGVASSPLGQVRPVAGCLSADQVAGYARGAGFPEYHIDDMVRIAWRESHYCPSAVNGGGPAYAGGPACGLLQLYKCPGPHALDPATNVALAFAKYRVACEWGSCLSPWGY